MLFGEQIKSIRLARGFTQKDVAAVAGIDISTLSKFENEKQKIADETYDRIFQALKLEKITKENYLNPNMEIHRELKKFELNQSRKLVAKGEKSEQEHKDLIDSLKTREREAKHKDYVLNEHRKIKTIKDAAK